MKVMLASVLVLLLLGAGYLGLRVGVPGLFNTTSHTWVKDELATITACQEMEMVISGTAGMSTSNMLDPSYEDQWDRQCGPTALGVIPSVTDSPWLLPTIVMLRQHVQQEGVLIHQYSTAPWNAWDGITSRLGQQEIDVQMMLSQMPPSTP